ncbi:acetylglucosaminylphosphatidylinositol deacetylase [Streptomyces spiroverticillatus]|uniref:Acetylglucosaminylphosphatidylinositol deacetylase n=1 Tax=Streptomyces finlayi TaxID=67296 RepID=A0A919CB26_9ACTN|nr:PIG-L family deacetylase [Streptomyces finlayi]GHA16314.1 acetylglucosaminylphosphatidylinositol deacetylase [Streptomyces spiroverticillatus]GHC98614.1 acetylglucosaminylphosphatidylinositol deacetylase [Streptomyces finlayi]
MTDATSVRPTADPIQAPGTPEAAWRAWPGWADLPDIPVGPFTRVAVVAAHPDDEVLGFGGTLALLAAAGTRITVVAVTDGEASHPDSTVLTADDLVRVRAAETRAALAELGAPEATVVPLHVPDTRVAVHEDHVAARLAEIAEGADLLVAPWTGDVHGDHEAAGRAALRAAQAAGIPCWLYPVWMWHWAAPGDPRVPWGRAARITLPPDVRIRKRAAIDRFVSQIAPLGPGPGDAAILPPDELAHHTRDLEVVFR